MLFWCFTLLYGASLIISLGVFSPIPMIPDRCGLPLDSRIHYKWSNGFEYTIPKYCVLFVWNRWHLFHRIRLICKYAVPSRCKQFWYQINCSWTPATCFRLFLNFFYYRHRTLRSLMSLQWVHILRLKGKNRLIRSPVLQHQVGLTGAQTASMQEPWLLLYSDISWGTKGQNTVIHAADTSNAIASQRRTSEVSPRKKFSEPGPEPATTYIRESTMMGDLKLDIILYYSIGSKPSTAVQRGSNERRPWPRKQWQGWLFQGR